MQAKLQHIIQKPFFLLLLPFFFFRHTWLENYNALLAGDTLKLSLIYTAAGIALSLLLLFWYKNFQEAALAAFTLLAINFFFGSVYSFIKKIPGGNFLSRYSVLLPAILVFSIVLLLLIRKSRQEFLRTAMYLNILLLVLIVWDSILLFKETAPGRGHYIEKQYMQLGSYKGNDKPDIYLLLADEYAGKQELQDIFSFDNSAFETALKERGFHIVDSSRSNYNSTIYSMASMFSMDYIDRKPQGASENYKDILFCRELIQRNNFTRFLEEEGYRIFNFSFVDISNEKRAVQNILPSNNTILTAPTLLYKLRYTFGAKLASRKKLDEIKTRELADNMKIDSLLKQSLKEKISQPKFVYAHFNMPHWPYFFDSAGNKIPLGKLTEEFKYDKKAYIEYLKYSNNKLLEYIDSIKTSSPKPPVIILMSDHGFRQLPAGTDQKYYFMNLNAISIPSGDYSRFYNGMSNVKQMSALLKTLFYQGGGPVKDTTLFIKDY